MRIDNIAVANFKGFEALRPEFPEADEASGVSGSFHLLIGPNAVVRPRHGQQLDTRADHGYAGA